MRRLSPRKLIFLSCYWAFSMLVTVAHAETRELSKFEITRIQKILNHYGHEVPVTGILDQKTDSAAKQLIAKNFPGRENNIRALYELDTAFLLPQGNNQYTLYSLEPKSESRGAINYNEVQKFREKYQRYLASPAVVFSTNGFIGRGNTIAEATADACSKSNQRSCKEWHVLAPGYTGCIAHYRFSPRALSLTRTKSTNYGVIVHKGAKVIITKEKPTIEQAKKEVCRSSHEIGGGCLQALELSCNF